MHYKINSESQSLISEPIDFTAIRMKAREKKRFVKERKREKWRTVFHLTDLTKE